MKKQNIFPVLLLTVMVLFVVSADGKSERQAAQSGEATTGKSIAVGKGPDAIFLTPDENYLYIANVEDSFISLKDKTAKVIETGGKPVPAMTKSTKTKRKRIWKKYWSNSKPV